MEDQSYKEDEPLAKKRKTGPPSTAGDEDMEFINDIPGTLEQPASEDGSSSSLDTTDTKRPPLPLSTVETLPRLVELEPDQDPFIVIDEMFSYHVPSGLVIRPFKKQLVMPNSKPFQATFPETYREIKSKGLNMQNYITLAQNCHEQNFIMVENDGLNQVVTLKEVFICGTCGKFAEDRQDQFKVHMKQEDTTKRSLSGGDVLRKHGFRLLTSHDLSLFILFDGVKRDGFYRSANQEFNNWSFKHINPSMLKQMDKVMTDPAAMADIKECNDAFLFELSTKNKDGDPYSSLSDSPPEPGIPKAGGKGKEPESDIHPLTSEYSGSRPPNPLDFFLQNPEMNRMSYQEDDKGYGSFRFPMPMFGPFTNDQAPNDSTGSSSSMNQSQQNSFFSSGMGIPFDEDIQEGPALLRKHDDAEFEDHASDMSDDSTVSMPDSYQQLQEPYDL